MYLFYSGIILLSQRYFILQNSTSMKITSNKNFRRASAIIGCLLVITASSCASYKTCPTYAKKTTKTAQSSVNS